MIKLLHAADLHLDSPFSGLSPEQARQRRREQRNLPRQLVELARSHGCDALLLAGDLFDSENAAPDTIDALRAAFAACPCPVFIAPGNHDFLAPGSAYLTADWPENVRVFKQPHLTAVELPQLRCRVFGAGFQSAYEPALLDGFSAPQDGWTNVMVLHGDALNPGSPYNAVTKEQIARSGLRYLALGHIHQASGLLTAGSTAYAWPGCAMGRGFDELGAKGAYLVTLTETDCALDFLPLEGRRYEILRVPAGGDALASVQAALPAEPSRDIYRVVLTGEADRPDLQTIYDRCAPRCFSLTLRDETTPKRDLWQSAGENTLRGLALGTLKAQYDAAEDDENRRTAALAARILLAAMEGRDEP